MVAQPGPGRWPRRDRPARDMRHVRACGVRGQAETAADGLSRASAEVYDLVILDLLMPGTDGFATLRQLLHDRPGQTVLVLSCLADVRHKVDCFDLGARDYLTKPFSLDELLARVRNQLRGFD